VRPETNPDCASCGEYGAGTRRSSVNPDPVAALGQDEKSRDDEERTRNYEVQPSVESDEPAQKRERQ
jgi:hypothetical protein